MRKEKLVPRIRKKYCGQLATYHPSHIPNYPHLVGSFTPSEKYYLSNQSSQILGPRDNVLKPCVGLEFTSG